MTTKHTKRYDSTLVLITFQSGELKPPVPLLASLCKMRTCLKKCHHEISTFRRPLLRNAHIGQVGTRNIPVGQCVTVCRVRTYHCHRIVYSGRVNPIRHASRHRITSVRRTTSLYGTPITSSFFSRLSSAPPSVVPSAHSSQASPRTRFQLTNHAECARSVRDTRYTPYM